MESLYEDIYKKKNFLSIRVRSNNLTQHDTCNVFLQKTLHPNVQYTIVVYYVYTIDELELFFTCLGSCYCCQITVLNLDKKKLNKYKIAKLNIILYFSNCPFNASNKQNK